LFAQLVHVGENVLSQQRRVPDGGGDGTGCGGGVDAVTVIGVVRSSEPHAAAAVSVMVSDPDIVPV
jgi:hypothetical protein